MDDATTYPPNAALPAPPLSHSIFASLGLMTSEEMSGVLQVSPQTLATWRCKKRGPPSIKLGKKVFYLISDFNDWTRDEARRQQGFRSKRLPAFSAGVLSVDGQV